MKKIKLVTTLLLLAFIAIVSKAQTLEKMETKEKPKTLYDFKVTDIDGNQFDMATLRGKKVLIVNVASKCGLTPQYEKLQELFEKYKDQNFVIVGFPANDFKGQEPGTNEEIKEFCVSKYDVAFPMMSKISVIGDSIAPIYQWLTQKKENEVLDTEVSWNFQKFLINEDGRIYDFVSPRENPFSEKIINWIEGK